MWRPSDATRRRWENKARTRGTEQCWLVKIERDGYKVTDFVALVLPMFPAHHTISRLYSRVWHPI